MQLIYNLTIRIFATSLIVIIKVRLNVLDLIIKHYTHRYTNLLTILFKNIYMMEKNFNIQKTADTVYKSFYIISTICPNCVTVLINCVNVEMCVQINVCPHNQQIKINRMRTQKDEVEVYMEKK